MFCVAGCFVCLARSDCRLAALAARFGGVRGGWPGGRRARGDGRAGLVWSVVKSGQVGSMIGLVESSELHQGSGASGSM